MKLDDVIRTQKDIEKMGHTIENNMIVMVGVDIIAHFGNAVCFTIQCENVNPMGCHQNLQNLGYVARAFIKLFDLSQEDGIFLQDIKHLPCRLVFEGPGTWGNRCIGFGHYMKDKFVLTDDFAKIDE